MRRPPDWLLVLALAAGVFLWQRTVFPLWHIDLFHIQLAALSWHTDSPERMYTNYDSYDQWQAEWYRPQADRLGAWGDANAYFYPPYLAGVFAPLSDVNVSVWRNSLFVINILLLFVFASQILRLSEERVTTRGFLWALALVLLTYPMARATKLGQIVPLLAALFWEGLLRLRTSRIASPILLGSVAALKVFPAGWLLWPVLKRRWSLLLGICAVIAAAFSLSLALMGWEIHRNWFDAVREFGSVVYSFFGNQSPAGWYTRAVLGHGMTGPYFEPTVHIRVIRLLFASCFLGSTVVLLIRARRLELPFALEQALLLSGILLALPVTWEHYYLFVLPPLGVLICHEWQRQRTWMAHLLAAAAFFFTMKLTHFYGDDPIGRIASGSQCLGLILFWLYCATLVWRFTSARSASV